MSVFVIWVDREHAKLFQFSGEKMERKLLQSSHQERAFFSEAATHLKDASRVLILGPGVAKHHFQNYLLEHEPLLAKKVVGCETVDEPTDPQIAAFARKLFNMPAATSSG